MSANQQASYHHGNLRQALLEAAERHLEQHGVEQLSLRAIAREVGVSQTAPYRHFTDKNALLAALAIEGFHRLFDAQLARGRDPVHDPAEALMQLGHSYVRFAREHSGVFRLMFGPALRPRSDYPPLFDAGREAMKGVQEIIERGLREGCFRPGEAPYLTNTAWAGVHGIAILILERADTFGYHLDLDTQVETSLRTFINGLRQPS